MVVVPVTEAFPVRQLKQPTVPLIPKGAFTVTPQPPSAPTPQSARKVGRVAGGTRLTCFGINSGGVPGSADVPTQFDAALRVTAEGDSKGALLPTGRGQSKVRVTLADPPPATELGTDRIGA